MIQIYLISSKQTTKRLECLIKLVNRQKSLVRVVGSECIGPCIAMCKSSSFATFHLLSSSFGYEIFFARFLTNIFFTYFLHIPTQRAHRASWWGLSWSSGGWLLVLCTKEKWGSITDLKGVQNVMKKWMPFIMAQKNEGKERRSDPDWIRQYFCWAHTMVRESVKDDDHSYHAMVVVQQHLQRNTEYSNCSRGKKR